MIISHSLRFVYIGPPKSATTSLHRWLRRPVVFDEDLDIDTSDVGGQHDHIVPEECNDYFTFSILRNEEDRVLSLWRMSRSEAQRGEAIPLLTLEEFLQWRKTAKPFYAWSGEQWLSARIDMLLSYERLPEDLNRLPFNGPLHAFLGLLPHVNRNPQNPKADEEQLLLTQGDRR
jgi:hypothetical protein